MTPKYNSLLWQLQYGSDLRYKKCRSCVVREQAGPIQTPIRSVEVCGGVACLLACF